MAILDGRIGRAAIDSYTRFFRWRDEVLLALFYKMRRNRNAIGLQSAAYFDHHPDVNILRYNLLTALGPMIYKADPDIRVLQTEHLKEDEVIRYTVRYQTEEGYYGKAYMLAPDNEVANLPIMLFLHGHGDASVGARGAAGLEKDKMHEVGLVWARKGYVVVAPNARGFEQLENHYRLYHELKFAHPTHPMLKFALDDSVALDVVLNYFEPVRERVASNRIIVVGHSMGGHRAMWLGVYDTRPSLMVVSGTSKLVEYQHGEYPNDCLIVDDLLRYGLDAEYLLYCGFPRPVLFSYVLGDKLFRDEEELQACRLYFKVKSFYGKLGAGDKVQISLDNLPEHELSLKNIESFVFQQGWPV